MSPSGAQPGSIRITSPGHLSLAAVMVWLGFMGLRTADFSQVWLPVPKSLPARELLVYLTAGVSLGCGLGLLSRRGGPVAARVLFAALLLWLLVLRFPYLFIETPLVLVAWSFGATSVMVAAAWVLWARLAGEQDRERLGFLAGSGGVGIARRLYGLALIPFGLAHFMYLDATTVLIPNWLPGHVALAYLTGSAFIAAGLAIVAGVLAPWAAALSTLQIGLFELIVWVPRVVTGQLNDFQRGEVIQGLALTVAAWVVAESYRPLSTQARQLGE